MADDDNRKTYEAIAASAEAMAKDHEHREDPRGACLIGQVARGIGAAAPHGRARVFVVGYADRDSEPALRLDGEVARVPEAASDLRSGWAPHPHVYEWLMGYPLDWTACEPSETP